MLPVHTRCILAQHALAKVTSPARPVKEKEFIIAQLAGQLVVWNVAIVGAQEITNVLHAVDQDAKNLNPVHAVVDQEMYIAKASKDGNNALPVQAEGQQAVQLVMYAVARDNKDAAPVAGRGKQPAQIVVVMARLPA